MADVRPEDRNYLIKLAQDKTIAGRRVLVATLSDLFLARSDLLSDREWTLMTEIFRQLIRDVEASVRRTLAEQLAQHANAPSELILTLANDEIEVAHPILVRSQVLQDVDLIEIIRNRTMEHQLAIAIRKHVSEPVSDALVATENVDVIKTLLENQGAQISKKTMEYLVEESQRVDTYQNPLLHRNDLAPELVNRMYWWVSAALRTYILENFSVDATVIDDGLEATVHTLADDLGTDAISKAGELAEKIAETQPITPQLMLSTLRHGEVALFIALFSRYTSMRSTLVKRMLFEPGGEGFCIACRGSAIDRSTFAALFMLTRRVEGAEAGGNPAQLAGVLNLFDRISVQDANTMLKKWRRDPEYLRAVWQIEQSAADQAAS